MARLRHPHVVTVYDVGVFDERIFLAMEYVDGTTLKRWMQSTRRWRETLQTLKAAGQGLAAAHEVGLVHRDFKPDNVLVGKDGRVLVSDFGIARAERGGPAAEPAQAFHEELRGSGDASLAQSPGAGDAEDIAGARVPVADPWKSTVQSASGPRTPTDAGTHTLTEEGSILGTVGYIAPEHLMMGTEDPRSDQFAFCITMYQALYRAHPFAHDDLQSYMEALEMPPRPPPPSNVPRWVHQVIERGLQRDPAARFATMRELLEALERDPSRRRRNWVIAAGVVAACAVAAGGWAHHRAELRAQCAAGQAIVSATWSGAAQEQVSAALRQAAGVDGPELATRVVAKLGEYARSWEAAYRHASEASLLRGEEPPAALERRLACLERDREAFEMLVSELAHADEAVAQQAIDSSSRLPRPATCATADLGTLGALPPPDRVTRVRAAERDLARAQALMMAGKNTEAIALAQHTLAKVRAIPYRRTEAELLLQIANSQSNLGHSEAVVEASQDAFCAAQAAGDFTTAARAAALAAFWLVWAQKTSEGTRWWSIAASTAEALPHDETLEVDLLKSRVEMGDYIDLTIESYDRYVRLTKQVYGDDNRRVAAA
jgi:hypothetical protein